MRKNIFQAFLLCAIILVNSAASYAAGIEAIGWKARVVKVADGDTVTVVFDGLKPDFCSDKERVRLIGINSTEMNFGKNIPPEQYAEKAKEYAEKTLLGKDVILSFDSVSDHKDRYGRLLCYVWIDGKLFNEMIVRDGLAYYYNKFQFEGRFMKRINTAQRSAQFDKVGLWSGKGRYF